MYAHTHAHTHTYGEQGAFFLATEAFETNDSTHNRGAVGPSAQAGQRCYFFLSIEDCSVGAFLFKNVRLKLLTLHPRQLCDAVWACFSCIAAPRLTASRQMRKRLQVSTKVLFVKRKRHLWGRTESSRGCVLSGQPCQRLAVHHAHSLRVADCSRRPQLDLLLWCQATSS